MSCALLIGAGLLVMSIVKIRSIDTGYDATRVLVAGLQLSNVDFADGGARSAAFAEILNRVSSTRGVSGVSVVRGLPGLGPTFAWDFEVREATGRIGNAPVADGMPVSHGYFATMDIALLEGRDFTAEESSFGSDPSLIVNETLASRHLGPNPIGKQIRIAAGDDSEPWLTVVGVVEDTHIGSRSGGIGMEPEPQEQIYVSWGVAPYPFGTLLVASDRDPMQLAVPIRKLVHEIAPSAPVYSIALLSEQIEDSTWAHGVFGTVFTVFGCAALILSAVGLYGVIAFGVDQRRPEIRLRLALGARTGEIARMILGEVGRCLLIGAVIGVVLGALIGIGIRSVLFEVGTVDLTVYSVVLLGVVGTGFMAVLLPARRSTEISLCDRS